MTTARPILATLVTLLCLPPGATAQLDGFAHAEFSAFADVGHLVVDASGASAGNVTVVVTHEDPLAGPVVDRVVTLDLAANASVRALIPDARLDVDLDVSILDGMTELPTLPDVEGLLNASAILELPDLARLRVPPIPHDARSSSTRVPVYPVHVGLNDASMPNLVVTPKGIVAFAWADATGLRLATSTNGGRSFDEPLTIATKTTEEILWHRSVATADGDVAVLYQTRAILDGRMQGDGWRLALVDPAQGRIVSDAGVGAAQGLRVDMAREELFATRDGLVLGFSGTVSGGTDEMVPIGLAGGTGVEIWSLATDGTLTRVGGVDLGGMVRSARLAISPSGDEVALVAAAGTSGPEETTWGILARSHDGGRTFEAPIRLDATLPRGRWILDVHAAAIDDLGTVHTVLTGYPWSERSGAIWPQGWYLRLPALGPSASRDLVRTIPAEHLAGQNASILWPQLTTRGARVGLLFDSGLGIYHAESLDAGLTWGASIRLEGPRGLHMLHLLYESAPGMLPDGRLVLPVSATDSRKPFELAVALPYDPEPPIAQGLVRILDPGAPTSTPSISVTGPDEGALPTAGNASLYLYAKNTGSAELRGDVVLVGVPDGVRWVSGIARFVLAPGESGGFGMRFEDLGAAKGNATATLLLRDEGRDVSIPFPIRLRIEGGAAPPRAAEEEPAATGDPETPTDEGSALGTVPEDGTIPGSARVTLRSSAHPTLTPGTEVRASVRIENTGDAVEDIVLHVGGLPEGIDARFEPAALTLAPGAVADVDLVLFAASATDPGEILAALTARRAGSEDALASGTVPVRVASGTTIVAPPTKTPFERLAPPAVAGAGFVLAGLALASLTDAGRLALGGGAAAFYTRLARADVLQHHVRSGVHAHIQAHPGIRYEDLRRDLALSNGALAHHLRVLRREGYVVVRSEWTRRRFYAIGDQPAAPAEDAPQRVERAIAELGEASPAQVAQALAISRQLARYHLNALAKRGTIEALGKGRGLRYRLAGAPPRRATFRVVERP